MSALSIPALRCGGPGYMPYSTVLSAGPLTMLFEEGQLRRIRVGQIEVVRRIYTSLRDSNWGTLPARLERPDIQTGSDNFSVRYAMHQHQDDFRFIWEVEISGSADGEIRFQAHGRAFGEMRLNRAAICTLHPLSESCGRPVGFLRGDGTRGQGRFPERIEPQQPFLNLRELTYELRPESAVRIRFEGEGFEMEDQRNWSDGSFKTYAPPQDRPKPFPVGEGWETRQTVTLTLLGEGWKSIPNRTISIAIRPSLLPSRPVPRWGFGLPSHGKALSDADLERLLRLSPSHLRVNIRMASPDWRAELRRGLSESRRMSVALEVAVLLSKASEDLMELAEAWRTAQGGAALWLLFSEVSDTVEPSLLSLARKILSPVAAGSRFGSGSKSDFVLLNRNRIPFGEADVLAFSVSPQVHLTDNRTLVEGLQGQAAVFRSAMALESSEEIRPSPISLKRSPWALSQRNPAAHVPPEFWKQCVDVRQLSLLGAGWTLASLKRLGLHASGKFPGQATYFEATGLLGVMAGSTLDKSELQIPDSDIRIDAEWVFPMYHVFADLAEFQGGTLADWQSQEPLRVDAMLLSIGAKESMLAANLEEKPVRIAVPDFSGFARLRRLNEKNAMSAMAEPVIYRQGAWEILDPVSGPRELELAPFEWIRLDKGKE